MKRQPSRNKCQAHARYIELDPKLHHVESREANNMPKGKRGSKVPPDMRQGYP